METAPGYTWCSICQEPIPDAIEDHMERHREQQPDRVEAVSDHLFFWLSSAQIGALGAYVVNALL